MTKSSGDLLKGSTLTLVLKCLSTKEMYGYELVQALSSSTDGVLAMGQSTLYPLLYSLESKGLVKGHWREAPTGRKRKYYAITAKGITRLKAELAQWRRLLRAMAALGLVGPAHSEF